MKVELGLLLSRVNNYKTSTCVDWDTAPQTHRDLTAVSMYRRTCISLLLILFFFFSLETFHKKKMRRKYIEAGNKRDWFKRTRRQALLSQKERRKRLFPFLISSNSAWATINKINRLAAALRCSSLCRIATPCQDLAWKDGIDSENKPIATLQHESPTGVPKKNARLGSLGTWSAHCYDNLIRSGTIYPDMVFTRRRWPIVSVSSSKVSTFSIVFVSSSKVCGYGSSSCKQEAYPERFLSG